MVMAKVGPIQQVHIALGLTPSEINVEWTTNGTHATTGQVAYGLSADSLTMIVNGSSNTFVMQPPFFQLHTATMVGLSAATKYFYQISTSGMQSKVFSFKSTVDATTAAANRPDVHVLFGDMGAACAFTLCPECTCNLTCDASTCTNKTVGLVSELEEASMFLHTGDFAYDFEQGYHGEVGHQFMRNIEQVAAYVPYMVSIGNHEDAPLNLAHYTERFRNMPSKTGSVLTVNGKAPNNWYYSWDAGQVHYIALTTEAWFDPLQAGHLETQYKWLINDLIEANKNRDSVPWIIGHGHRSVYCSCDKDCDGDAAKIRGGKYGLEEIFMKYGVDFWINGHEHDYERSFPMYQNKSDQSNINPKAPIYVVTGAAGSHELHEPFTRPQPEWSAFRSNSFGYSKIKVYNASHLRWQQIQTDPLLFGPDLYGRVIDDAWIIQEKHGPFNLEDAPKGRRNPQATQVSYDHWNTIFTPDVLNTDGSINGINGGKVTIKQSNNNKAVADKAVANSRDGDGGVGSDGDGDGDGETSTHLEVMISNFRKKFGEGKWKEAEMKELEHAKKVLGSKDLIWEDLTPWTKGEGRPAAAVDQQHQWAGKEKWEEF